MPDTEIRLVYMTTPDLETATALGHELVEKRLIACGNILPQMHSVYRWEGEVKQAQECVLIGKTTAAKVSAISDLVQAKNPYDLPAVVALSVDGGLPGFLNWIAGETSDKSAD